MNATTNLCNFTGRITKDPTESIQNLPNGGTKLSLGLAVKTPTPDKDGEVYERTDYPQLVIWGDLAEQAAIELQKGMVVEVQAQLQTRRWKAEDGSYRYATEFLVTAIRPKAKAPAA
jgi:single-strand DNA-binding protein